MFCPIAAPSSTPAVTAAAVLAGQGTLNIAWVMVAAGLGAFDPVALDKKLTGKVVSVYPAIGELDEGFRGQCSPQDLETMMQLVFLYATDFTVSEREPPKTVKSVA